MSFSPVPSAFTTHVPRTGGVPDRYVLVPETAIRRPSGDHSGVPATPIPLHLNGLPPARDLAAVLGVNTNTVLRALRQLREEDLLEFRRGRGITVLSAPERGELIAQARDLVRLARRHGYRLEELLELIQNVA